MGGIGVKQLSRVFRSRFFWAAVCIVLEFVQLLAVFILLFRYFLPITILGWAFHVAALIYMLNRHEIPERKLTWLLIIMLLPVVGAFIYMLLASNDTSKKEYQRCERAALEVHPYLQENPALEALKGQDTDAWLQASYLYRAAEMPCYAGIKTTYYPLGENFHRALLEDLSRAVRNLTALFLVNWNTHSKNQLEAADFMVSPAAAYQGTGFVIPFGDGPKPIYMEDIGKGVYLNMIHAAREYLYITTPYLICDHEVLDALCLAGKKGVDVRLITPHIPDKRTVFWMTRSNYKVLMDAGVKIYEYTPGFIHAKNFVCDDKFAVCGTINLDYRSLVHHFECGAWMYGTDCIPDMKADFLNTLAASGQVPKDRPVMRGWQRIIVEVAKVFFPMF
jgi:phosphatidylserine/phosphatidylglycerophosphate/cardiolipin synthase-like enzyme